MAGIGGGFMAPASAGKSLAVRGFGGGSGGVQGPADLASSAISKMLNGGAGGNSQSNQNMGITQGMPNRPGSTPGAPGAPAPGAPGAPTTNTANPNPVANTAIEGLGKAAAAPNAAGTQATQGLFDQASNKSGLYGQIDQNIQDIRDRASMGIAGSQQLNRVKRGVSGSGIDVSDKAALDKAQQNDINRMTTDATLGWEKERSANLNAAGNMGLATSGQQIGANTALGSMGLSQGNQQLAQQAEARAMQNQVFQQNQQQEANIRDSQMQGWNTILNLLT